MNDILEKRYCEILRKIPNTTDIIILKEGKIIGKTKAPQSISIDDSEAEFIAELIQLRHHVAGFHKILNGLQITINVFREHCIFVTHLDESLVLIIITRDVDTENTRQIISKLRSEYAFG